MTDGAKLAAAVKEHGISVVEMAKHLHTSRSLICSPQHAGTNDVATLSRATKLLGGVCESRFSRVLCVQ
jgi:hypothetical protein